MRCINNSKFILNGGDKFIIKFKLHLLVLIMQAILMCDQIGIIINVVNEKLNGNFWIIIL